MRKRSKTNKIIIHCSATPSYMDIGAERIRKWHKHRGWSDIGYHFVITRQGWLEEGRRIDYVGAHCKGQNHESRGICLGGGSDSAGNPENNVRVGQFKACQTVIVEICSWYSIERLAGDKEFSYKACPSLKVRDYLKLPCKG